MSMVNMTHPFDVDTRTEPASSGVRTATVSDRWDAIGGTANGGYLLAIALNALRHTLPVPDPLAVSAFYLRPGRPGPAEVSTELVRAGRRVSTGEARLSQGGKEILRTVATFTDFEHTSGRTTVLNSPPDLPPPDDCVDLTARDRLTKASIVDRIQYRAPKPPGWLDGNPSGDPTAEFWMRFAGGRDADPLSLPLFVDAAAPVILELGEFATMTLELTVHVRARPAPGWLACRVTTRHVQAGLHEEDFEIWDSSGTLVAQSRQLAMLAAPA